MQTGHSSPRPTNDGFDGVASSIIDLAPRPTPVDEPARLAALEELLLLDTLPEAAYDELVAIAAEVCGVPIALVSLVDRSRQWFKARVGLCAPETPRDVAFCDHAIRQPDALFVVTDAHCDPRFADNPLVTGEPFVRFYAGAPIVTAAGAAVGTLCVIDTVPRTLTPGQQLTLKFLARQAAATMDARRHALEAARQAGRTAEVRLKQEKGAELLELVLRSHDLGLWDLDVPSGTWTTNAREQEMLGYRAGEADPSQVRLEDIVHPDDWSSIRRSMEPHLRGDAPYYECTHRMRHRDGGWLWILARAIVVERDAHGAARRIVGTHLDVTERRRIDAAHVLEAERRRVLLKEASEFIFVINRGLCVTEANDSFARALGYTLAEVMQLRPWNWDANYPDEASFAKLLPTWPTEPKYVEARWRRKDGSLFDVEISSTPVNCNGEKELMLVCRDITEAKQNRAALDAAHQMLEQTAAMARVGGWEVDLVADRLTWSAEVYRIHEVDASWTPRIAEAIAFYAPEARPVIAAAVADAIATGRSYDLEVPLVTARGRRIWVRTLGRAEFEGERAVRLVGAFQDITERRAAQDALVASERRLRTITDNLPAMISHVDRDERYTFANAHLARVYRQSRESLVGKTLREVRSEQVYADGAPHVAAVLRGERVQFEAEAFVNGRHLHYESHYVPDVAADGRVDGFFALTFDISDRKRAELQVQESERRLRGVADNVPALFAEIGTDGCFRFVNANYGRWFGGDAQVLVGRSIASLGAQYYDGRTLEIKRALAGEHVVFEREVRLPAGMRTLHTTYVPHFDAECRVAGFYALTSDITELKETQRKLEALACIDPLTGLGNRRQFDERMPEALARARRTGRTGAVLYFDIDRFKSINDTLGHGHGDTVLRLFAERVQHCLRETDFVARHAGDEFVAILENVGAASDARAVAQKLVGAVRPPMSLGGTSLAITTSIGIALFDGSEDLEELLARADAALYVVKERGRDGFEIAAVAPSAVLRETLRKMRAG